MSRRQWLSIALATINFVWPLIAWWNLATHAFPNGLIIWGSLTLITLASVSAGLWSIPVAAYLGSIIGMLFFPALINGRGLNDTIITISGAVWGVGVRSVWLHGKDFCERVMDNPSSKRRGPLLWLADRPRKFWFSLVAMGLWIVFLFGISFLLVWFAMSGWMP